MSSPESNFSAWLRKADHDLLNIENNLAATDIPWDTVCVHAQQVAEKVLKAFLVFHGRDLSKTHDLVALLESLSTAAPESPISTAGEGMVESVGSIGLRLAYQLERVLHAEVIVALSTPSAVRVIGTSSRADRRLLDMVAQPGSPRLAAA